MSNLQFLLAAALAVTALWVLERRQRRIERWPPIEAEVVTVQKVPRGRKFPMFRLRVRYPVSGSLFETEVLSTERPDSHVVVHYDPRHPERAVVLGPRRRPTQAQAGIVGLFLVGAVVWLTCR